MGCVCLRLPVIISLFSTNHHLSTRTAASLWRIERYLFINPRKKQKEQPFLSKLRPQWNRYSHAFFVMGPRSIFISKMMIIHQITFQSHHQPTSQPLTSKHRYRSHNLLLNVAPPPSPPPCHIWWRIVWHRRHKK